MTATTTKRKPLWRLLLAVSLLLVVVLPLIARSLFLRNAITTETIQKISNLNGADIEITYYDEDLLAKSEYVNVYFSPAGRDDSLLKRLTTQKELIFSYDPGNGIHPETTPAVRRVGPNVLAIDLAQASSIVRQKQNWNDQAITYNIHHVGF